MNKGISQNCIDLVKEFEGCQLKAYADEGGVWTIGYGITNSDRSITGTTIKKGLTISKTTAEEWLKKSLTKKYLPYVMEYDSKYDWNQNEIDALVSFAYNIGSIGGLTKVGSRSRAEIAEMMMKYNSVKGVGVLRGLTRRRTAERKLFLTPVKTAKKTQEDYLKERVSGVNYFKELENNDVDDIKEFLHKRGFGAGEPNLSKIAAANATSDVVKKALFKLAKRGLLIKPEGLNKLDA